MPDLDLFLLGGSGLVEAIREKEPVEELRFGSAASAGGGEDTDPSFVAIFLRDCVDADFVGDLRTNAYPVIISESINWKGSSGDSSAVALKEKTELESL